MFKQILLTTPTTPNGHQQHITMAARGYSAGTRPTLVRSDTTVRYDRPRSRPTKRRRTSSAGSIKKQLMQLAETKHLPHRTDGNTTLVSDIILNDAPEGTGQHQRVGSKLTVTGVFGRFQLRARNQQGLMRIIFYRPRKADESLIAQSLGVFGHVDMDEFVVYHDQYYPLSNGNGPDWQIEEVKLKFPNGLITTFDDSSNEIQDNPLRMWIGGWNTLTPDEHSYDIQCFYKDV